MVEAGTVPAEVTMLTSQNLALNGQGRHCELRCCSRISSPDVVLVSPWTTPVSSAALIKTASTLTQLS